jgi:two-component system chemotaxis sensor kinase CheA
VAAPAASAAEPQAGTAAPVSAGAANTPASGAANPQHQKESLISVHQSKLDQLSALVGEIVITEAMVTGSPDLKGLGNLDIFSKSARQLRKLTDELQDISMSLRMVPIATSFQKMNRIVRDMSKKLDKRAKLTIIGEDTEVEIEALGVDLKNAEVLMISSVYNYTPTGIDISDGKLRLPRYSCAEIRFY